MQVIARKYVATAAAEGQWVLLQNTHLGLGYLAEVEQHLVRAEELHEDFRWGPAAGRSSGLGCLVEQARAGGDSGGWGGG